MVFKSLNEFSHLFCSHTASITYGRIQITTLEFGMETTKRFIRLPEVINRTGYRRTSIYEKISEGTFPAPIKLGPRAVAWVSEEIEKWMDARVAERDAV